MIDDGFRGLLRRLAWLGFPLVYGPLAVAAESLRPGRGHAARIASRGARRLIGALGVPFEVHGLSTSTHRPGPEQAALGGAPARAAPAGEPVYSSRSRSGRRKP